MIKGIDVIFIHAKDPQKLSLWYEDILGMKIKFKTPDNSWQEFLTTDGTPPVRFAIDFPREQPSGPGIQSIIISFRVDNLSEVISKLEERGIIFYGEQKVQDTGKTLFATFRDPEGNWLQISQRKENTT
jgi:catechol 2,3-dioxygenase-like lactoylglutathione lyase family enzyme